MVGLGIGVILVLLDPVKTVEVSVKAVKAPLVLHPEQHKEGAGEAD